ncbi:MAG: PadR family transcriptional regulator [Proteobacteria bacterium]|nr:PadR family transcriptional regulator [Pseudomonadota bacterium]
MFGYCSEDGGGHWSRRFARDETPEAGRHGRHRGGHHGGHHGGASHQFFREGGGGRSRVFDQGELRFVLLALIAQAPRHGYEIIKEIEDRLGGSYSPSPGVIYPTLTLLNELGFATVSESGGGRKLYTITEEGQAHLAENKPMVDGVFARMERASASTSGGRSPQVVRAIENMKTALRLRLSRGPLAESEAQAIADALDAAARAIERA